MSSFEIEQCKAWAKNPGIIELVIYTENRKQKHRRLYCCDIGQTAPLQVYIDLHGFDKNKTNELILMQIAFPYL